MAKLKSEYLNKEFEVSSFEAQEEGDTVEVVSHAALEHIAHNLLPAELQTRYELIPLLLSPDHCVAKCVFSDKTDRRITAIGEALQSTLSTEIARNHPATMAFNRAFDRALLRYLNVPGKILSNSESNPTDGAVSAGETIVDTREPAQEATGASQSNDEVTGGANTRPVGSNAQRASEGQREAPEPNKRSGSPEKSRNTGAPRSDNRGSASGALATGIEELANIPINTRKYNKVDMTIGKLYTTDAGYFKWICDTFDPSKAGPGGQELKNACLKYRALMEGKK
jgi:hypothetical protein